MKNKSFCKIVYILLIVCTFSIFTGCGPAKSNGDTGTAQNSSEASSLAQEGNALVLEGRYEEAIPLLEKAVELGDPVGLQTLGWCYFFGYGVDKDDDKAFSLYMQAADQGYVLADYAVGYCYYYGVGADQDYDEAAKYFKLAADQDLVDAWVAMGECYYYGNGVEKDFEESAKWYQKALDADFEPSEEDQKIINEVLGK